MSDDPMKGEPRFLYQITVFTHDELSEQAINFIAQSIGQSGALVVDVGGPVPKSAPGFKPILDHVVMGLIKQGHRGALHPGKKDTH